MRKKCGPRHPCKGEAPIRHAPLVRVRFTGKTASSAPRLGSKRSRTTCIACPPSAHTPSLPTPSPHDPSKTPPTTARQHTENLDASVLSPVRTDITFKLLPALPPPPPHQLLKPPLRRPQSVGATAKPPRQLITTPLRCPQMSARQVGHLPAPNPPPPPAPAPPPAASTPTAASSSAWRTMRV